MTLRAKLFASFPALVVALALGCVAALSPLTDGAVVGPEAANGSVLSSRILTSVVGSGAARTTVFSVTCATWTVFAGVAEAVTFAPPPTAATIA
jgi:hypothetical protein